jgi:hypothetical protein
MVNVGGKSSSVLNRLVQPCTQQASKFAYQAVEFISSPGEVMAPAAERIDNILSSREVDDLGGLSPPGETPDPGFNGLVGGALAHALASGHCFPQRETPRPDIGRHRGNFNQLLAGHHQDQVCRREQFRANGSAPMVIQVKADLPNAFAHCPRRRDAARKKASGTDLRRAASLCKSPLGQRFGHRGPALVGPAHEEQPQGSHPPDIRGSPGLDEPECSRLVQGVRRGPGVPSLGRPTDRGLHLDRVVVRVD